MTGVHSDTNRVRVSSPYSSDGLDENLGDLTKDFTPERRRRVDDVKRELLAEMPLHELRRARALTQRDMA